MAWTNSWEQGLNAEVWYLKSQTCGSCGGNKKYFYANRTSNALLVVIPKLNKFQYGTHEDILPNLITYLNSL